MRRVLSLLLALAFAGPVAAQDRSQDRSQDWSRDRLTVRAEPAAGLSLGPTVRGSTASVFSISPTGEVRRLSGDAIRMSNAPVAAPRVVITCLEDGRSGCTRPLRVRVMAVSGTARTSIRRFVLGGVEGARLEGGGPSPGPALDFDLTPLGQGGAVGFALGLELRVEAGGGGREDFNYVVMVLPL